MDNFLERFNHVVNDVLKTTSYRISKDLKVSTSGVHVMLSGRSKPGIDFVEKFCLEYDISSNYLLLNVGPIRISSIDIKAIDHHFEKTDEEMINKIDALISDFQELKQKYSNERH